MKATGFPPEVRAIIVARALGCCEKCGYGSSDMEAHHRRPRGMGGSRRVDTNVASNGVLLCGSCHRIVESHRTHAYAAGFLVHQQHDPLSTPLLRRGQWVLLDDDGQFYRIPKPAGVSA